jgi:hypothetical protein
MQRFHEKAVSFLTPNAGLQAPLMAEATQERRLLAVACKPGLGAGSAEGLWLDNTQEAIRLLRPVSHPRKAGFSLQSEAGMQESHNGLNDVL